MLLGSCKGRVQKYHFRTNTTFRKIAFYLKTCHAIKTRTCKPPTALKFSLGLAFNIPVAELSIMLRKMQKISNESEWIYAMLLLWAVWKIHSFNFFFFLIKHFHHKGNGVPILMPVFILLPTLWFLSLLMASHSADIRWIERILGNSHRKGTNFG